MKLLTRPGIRLLPLTGEMNSTNYLFIMAPVVGRIYYATQEHFVPKVVVLEAGKMGKQKDVSECDRGQTA